MQNDTQNMLPLVSITYMIYFPKCMESQWKDTLKKLLIMVVFGVKDDLWTGSEDETLYIPFYYML